MASAALIGCSGDRGVAPSTAGLSSFLVGTASGLSNGLAQTDAMPTNGTGPAPTVTLGGTPISSLGISPGQPVKLQIVTSRPATAILVGVRGQPGRFRIPIASTRVDADSRQYSLELPTLPSISARQFLLTVVAVLDTGETTPATSVRSP